MSSSFSGKYSVHKARAPKRGPGAPTEKQINGLRKQMEGAVSLDFANGLKTFRKGIDPEAMLKAFLSGNYKSVMDYNRGPDPKELLQDAADRLAEAANKAADITIKRGLPKDIGNRLAFDNRNENIRQYVETRTGALVQGVDDDTKSWLSALVKENFVSVRDTQKLTADVADKLRDGIGLNERQSAALAAFGANNDPEQTAIYGEKLLQQRANMIARTETSYATNQGQLIAVQSAKDEGVIAADSRKRWYSVGKLPCLICDPMDQVEVEIDEEFLLPTGETILCPPAHPNCECLWGPVGTEGGTDNPKPTWDSDEEEDVED